ncbi:MAG: hypothetical protein ABII23_03445 [bacterium]
MNRLNKSVKPFKKIIVFGISTSLILPGLYAFSYAQGLLSPPSQYDVSDRALAEAVLTDRLALMIAPHELGEKSYSEIFGAEVYPIIRGTADYARWGHIPAGFEFYVHASENIVYAHEFARRKRGKRERRRYVYMPKKKYFIFDFEKGIFYNNGHENKPVSSIPPAVYSMIEQLDKITAKRQVALRSSKGILYEALNAIRIRWWKPELHYFWTHYNNESTEVEFYSLLQKPGQEEEMISIETPFNEGITIADIAAFNDDWELSLIGESGINHTVDELVEKLYNTYVMGLDVAKEKRAEQHLGSLDRHTADTLVIYFDGVDQAGYGDVNKEELARIIIDKLSEELDDNGIELPKAIIYEDRINGIMGTVWLDKDKDSKPHVSRLQKKEPDTIGGFLYQLELKLDRLKEKKPRDQAASTEYINRSSGEIDNAD